MTQFFAVVGNRDSVWLGGARVPFWQLLDEPPDGWLTSLAYQRDDLPAGRRRIGDCGAWSYKLLAEPRIGRHQVDAAWALDQYQEMLAPGDFAIAPDHMLIRQAGIDLEERRSFNRAQAAAFLVPARAAGLRPMAVAHGLDLEERLASAAALIELGYDAIAIGGIAGQVARRSFVVETVQALREALPGVWLHVLGVSAPSFFEQWLEIGVESCDGASCFKQAFQAGRFFVADGTRLVAYQAARPGEPITAPECQCRACTSLRADGVDTRSYGSNQTNMGRAAHNLNQQIQVLAALRAAVDQRPAGDTRCHTVQRSFLAAGEVVPCVLP